jgi:hypothetical protein
MKTKHLGVVAACVVALTVGTANATTYNVQGGNFTSFLPTCAPGSLQPACGNLAATWSITAGPLTGTVDIDGGLLTGVNLTVGESSPGTVGHTFLIPGIPTVISKLSFTSQDMWSLSLSDTIHNLSFADSNGLIVGATYIYSDVNPAIPVVTYSGVTGTITAIPLPTALPLFAAGIVGLGLLGWRGKRKTARIAA